MDNDSRLNPYQENHLTKHNAEIATMQEDGDRILAKLMKFCANCIRGDNNARN